MRQAEEISLNVRGIQLGGLYWKGEAPKLVMLHGWQDQAGVWLKVAESLPNEILALDLRGFGRSDHNPIGYAYAFAEYLVDLDQLLAQEQAPVVLVGHSMGGTIASMYAGLRPEKLLALVLVDGLGIMDGLLGAFDRLKAHLDSFLEPERPQKLIPDIEAAAERIFKIHPYLTPEHAYFLAERGTKAVEGGRIWRVDPRHKGKLAVPYRQDQHRFFLRQIQAPTLLIHPEEAAFSAEDQALLEAEIRDQETVVLPCGHMVPLQQPVLLAHAIGDFLRQRFSKTEST
jgi:pimeloyl-ACP methyl ester carboxylesterase